MCTGAPSVKGNRFAFHIEPNYLSTSEVDTKQKLIWELAAMVFDSPKRDQWHAEIKCRHTDQEHHECSQNEREVVAEKGDLGSRSPHAREHAHVSIPRPVFEIADPCIYCQCGRMLSDEVKAQCQEQKFRTWSAATRIVWPSCKNWSHGFHVEKRRMRRDFRWRKSGPTSEQKQEEIRKRPFRTVRCITWKSTQQRGKWGKSPTGIDGLGFPLKQLWKEWDDLHCRDASSSCTLVPVQSQKQQGSVRTKSKIRLHCTGK